MSVCLRLVVLRGGFVYICRQVTDSKEVGAVPAVSRTPRCRYTMRCLVFVAADAWLAVAAANCHSSATTNAPLLLVAVIINARLQSSHHARTIFTTESMLSLAYTRARTDAHFLQGSHWRWFSVVECGNN